jgi:predicted Zn-dependent peptidase
MSYKKTILDNGITVLSEHVEHVRSISIGAWINAGSRDEAIHNRGIAHFLEHMLFKGTTSRSKIEIANFLESLGGSINAFTSKEYTCIYARCLEEYLEQSVDLISDLLLHSTFPDDELQKEKEVVIDEINDIQDTPGDLIFDYFYENLFPNNSLGYPIVGYKEEVANFEKPTCTSFISEHYKPQRFIISVSGYIDHQKLVRFAERYFNFEKMSAASKRILSPPESIKKYKNIYTKNANHQSHVCIGTRTFPYTDKDRYILLTLNAILSGGMSSRLFQNIREKHGISYDIGSFADFFHDTGCIGVYAATNPKNSKKSIELINQEIQTFIEKPVEDLELERTKALLKSSILIGLESTSARMNRLAKQYIYNKKINTIDQVIAQIEKITPEDIQRVAQRIFNKENFVTTILQASKKQIE